MSKFIETLGNKNSRNYDIDIKEYRFVELKELHAEGESKVHRIDGAFYQHGKNGLPDRVVVILGANQQLVALPPHLTEKAQVLCTDSEIIDEVKSAKCGFTVYSYTNEKYHKLCYSVRFVEC